MKQNGSEGMAAQIIAVSPRFPAMRRRIAVTRNEGTIDRLLRVVVGLILIALVFVGPRTAWGWIGVVPLLTGLVGMCPIYSLLGINTCPRR